MEKLDEIIKTLDFYVRSNELKNKIIDEPNNYSVEDHLFGSMILATAIDSEFKETIIYQKYIGCCFFPNLVICILIMILII